MTDAALLAAIAVELNLPFESISAAAKLLDGGATVPFIARYRQEATGRLDEEQIRDVEDRLASLRGLAERRTAILASVEAQGQLTPELRAQFEGAATMQALEDLYLPYRPKRRTRAMVARERGLEGLADLMWAQVTTAGAPEKLAAPFVDPELGVLSAQEALAGAQDIVAERISDDAAIRAMVRERTLATGEIVSTIKDARSPEKATFETYADWRAPISRIKPYQTLALNRGESVGVLRVEVAVDEIAMVDRIASRVVRNRQSVFTLFLEAAALDGYGRLIAPAIGREVRTLLSEAADRHGIEVFAQNLRHLLLQPPVAGKTILGIDPGFASGCKVTVIDPTGKRLLGTTIYPTPPRSWTEKSALVLRELIETHGVDLIAIGNGTGGRETETFVAGFLKSYDRPADRPLQYLMVSEAGASVYSASPVAREEFPELEASQRGVVSIARRVLDPLAELVKIDPKAIGVGLYQHDVDQKQLSVKLGQVVESCVNRVGVDLNTASASLLAHIAGLNRRTAAAIVRHRDERGRFRRRDDLKAVPGIGPAAYEQAAGFLRIPGGDEPLDNTQIHPESYPVVRRLVERLGLGSVESAAGRLDQALSGRTTAEVARDLAVGVPTLDLILQNLRKPGRDPRATLEGPLLRSDVLKLSDLRTGMALRGTVRNVVDFGAFVDIGVESDGLLHVSRMNRDGTPRVTDPHDRLAVGQVIEVEIESVDPQRKRIALRLPGAAPAVDRPNRAEPSRERRERQLNTPTDRTPSAKPGQGAVPTPRVDPMDQLRAHFGSDTRRRNR